MIKKLNILIIFYFLFIFNGCYIDNSPTKVISSEYRRIDVSGIASYYIITIEGHEYISPCLGCSNGKLIHSESCPNIKCNETIK